MTDVFTKRQRRRIMQAVRREGTAPEMRLAEALAADAHRFIRNSPDLPGRPDFFLQDLGVVVFVHGCFWHGHPRCPKGATLPKSNRIFWERKTTRNRRRDRCVARRLRALGLRVYTIWECEIKRGLSLRLRRRLSILLELNPRR